MKRKIKLLSLISALAICATTAFTACNNPVVGEHDHVWDEGAVTTEATCGKEGVKTYNCKVDGCTQNKTEPVAMLAHSWNGGEVTKQPKCNEEGVKTFTCTFEGCGKTKEETVEKTAHRYGEGLVTAAPDFLNKGIKTFTCLDCGSEKAEAVEEHADFSEQFYTTLTESNNWLYGYANTYDKETGAIDFVRITETENELWKTEKTEIGKGYVYSENNAVIAYSFNETIPQLVQANVSISFVGEEAATVLNAYLIINGECVSLNKSNAKDWSYQTEDALDIAQGDTFYLVLENNGEGKAGGNLSITFTAPCVHVWDGGKIIKDASCTEEGVKEYGCISCDKKITGAAEKLPHKYGEGEETIKPTETSAGEMTYKCLNCGDVKTETIPKLPSSVFNGADYGKDFSTAPSSDWKYGYTDNYNFDTNTFTFNELKPYGDAWEDNGGGIEIKSGWFKNETDGAQAVIRYIMPQTREINISLSFAGSDGNSITRISGRLHIQKADGSVQSCDFINGTQGSSWTYSDKVTVEAGSAISILFFNEGHDGWFHGSFSMTLTAEGQDIPPTEEEIGNFYEDFSTDGSNNWVYGYATEYNWGNDNFTFNALIANAEKGEWGGVDGLVIKRDWVLAEGAGDLAVGYKVPDGQNKLKVEITFTHAPDSVENGASPTRLSARVLVVGADGKTKSVEFINKGTSSWQATQEVSVADGDTVYVILFREAEGWRQGTLQITVKGKKTEEPEPEFNGASFKDDFRTENQDGAWGYGYMENPWDDNRRFETCTQKTDDAWIFNDGEFNKVEIKSGWIAVNKETTISYTATAAVSANVKVEFEGGEADTKMGIRIFALEGGKLVEKAFNESKNDEGKQVVELAYDFEAGETIYVMFSVANWGAATNGRLDITITKA